MHFTPTTRYNDAPIQINDVCFNYTTYDNSNMCGLKKCQRQYLNAEDTGYCQDVANFVTLSSLETAYHWVSIYVRCFEICEWGWECLYSL